MKYDRIVLNIPHASDVIKNKEGFVVQMLDECHLNKIDIYTDLLYQPHRHLAANVFPVVFPYSRFWCDVERFWDNSMEVEFSKGQGAIYTHDDNGIRYREITPELSIDCAEEYKNHWGRIKAKLSGYNSLLLDCHSYTHESHFTDVDFNIGYNDGNIPAIYRIAEILETNHYTVGFNEPFKGVYEIKPYDGVMIEVNKNVYCGNENDMKTIHHLLNDIYAALLLS
jgi:N-formylglutamate amidohydrolase